MDRLVEWSRSAGVEVHDSIDLLASGEYGSQGTAVFDIPENTELCSIPFSQCITPELACKALHLPFDKICEQNLEITVLAAYLLHERDAEHSPWSAYISALPKTLDTPAFWNDVDLLWLRGTNLDGEPNVRSTRMLDQVKRLQGMMNTADEMDQDDWKWAYGIIHSRSFPSFLIYRDSDRSASHPILLPVLDTFNHRPATAITWSPDYETCRLSFVSGQRYAAGEQVFNNYGAKSNEEFLMSYGFCLADSTSDHLCLKLPGLPDPFCLTWTDLVSAALLSAMAERLDVDLSTSLGQVVARDSLQQALAQKRERLVQFAPTGSPSNARQRHAQVYRAGQVALIDAAVAALRRSVRALLDTAALTLRQVWPRAAVVLAALLPDVRHPDMASAEQGELCGLDLSDLLVAAVLSDVLLQKEEEELEEMERQEGRETEMDEFWSHFGERIQTCTHLSTRDDFGRALSRVAAAAWRDEHDRTYYLGLTPLS